MKNETIQRVELASAKIARITKPLIVDIQRASGGLAKPHEYEVIHEAVTALHKKKVGK